MRRKILVLLSVILLMCGLLCACDSSSSIERDLNSGMDKFINGDTDSMTPGERNQVEGFLEWQSGQ